MHINLVVVGHLLRLPNPMQDPKRSSSNPPAISLRRWCRQSLSTAWICSLHSLLLMMVRSYPHACQVTVAADHPNRYMSKIPHV